MKTYQSKLPAATRKDCRLEAIGRKLRAKLSEIFRNGFWFCLDCEKQCERVEGEQGRPDHCDQCGSHRIQWNPPAWSDQIQDTKIIHPGEL